MPTKVNYPAGSRPDTLSTGLESSQYWADRVARDAIAHSRRAARGLVTVRSASSPSGGKHIGNMNDQVRAYFIHLAVEDAGCTSRVVQTSDDMDPLRVVPSRLPDGEGEWRELARGVVQEFSSHLGEPVSRVDDPFGCHGSWAEHFTVLLDEGLRSIDVKLETYYVSEMYRRGEFDPVIRETLSKLDKVREVMSRFRSKDLRSWIPFQAVCENCGKIATRAVSFDMNSWTVEYECTGGVLHGKYAVKGCGHKGTTSLRNGKLPWRIEWVADWKLFDTDAEPFGKEHYEGSWKSGVALAREVFGFEPPVPLVYEFFLVDGQKMSSRLGNAYTLHDLSKIMEPEVIRYIYTKRPIAHRDVAIKSLPKFVDEFDRFERSVFEGKAQTEILRTYRFLFERPPTEKPYRVPYSVAAYIVQFYPPEEAFNRMVSSGMVPSDLDERNSASVMNRLRLASNWVKLFAGEEYKVVLRQPPAKVDDPRIKRAFEYVSSVYSEKEMDGDALQNLLYEAAKKFGVPTQRFFEKGYEITIGKRTGPRLGPFLATLDKGYVVKLFSSLEVEGPPKG